MQLSSAANNRGVVHSQRGCADFKSSKKSLDLLDFFRIFSDFLDFFGCTKIL